MARYIDVELFKAELNMGHYTGDITGSNDVEKLLDLQPTADAKEVVRGKWIGQSSDYEDFCECSICGHYQEDDSDFCPSCGADMREVE